MKLNSIDPTSTTLLDRVGANPHDQAAWARFVGLYGPKIRGWCWRWGLQAADTEDATQDVLLRLAQKLGTFRYDVPASFTGVTVALGNLRLATPANIFPDERSAREAIRLAKEHATGTRPRRH